MSELRNQTTIDDYLPKPEPAPIEGYDENGHLIDPGPISQSDAQAPAETADAAGAMPTSPASTPDPVGAMPTSPASIPEPAGAMPSSPDVSPETRLNAIAAEINTLTEHARGAVLAAALAIGKRLIEAKQLVPRGRFGEWLRASVDYSERKAQDMMRLYEEYGQGTIPEAVARLDYTKAVALLQLPEGEREGMAERAADEGLSSRQLQAEIDRLRAQQQQDQVKIYDLIQQGETAEQAIQLERDAAERARGDATAARNTADKLRADLKRVKTDASGAIARATAAEADRKDALAQLEQARAELEKLKAARPAPVEVERIPDDVAQELQRLRAGAARGEAEQRVRMGYERMSQDLTQLREAMAALRAEDPAAASKYAAAVGKALTVMAGQIGGN